MNALTKFSKQAARSYLQSAVFVDDNIFNQAVGLPAEPVVLPAARKAVYRLTTGSKAAAKETPVADVEKEEPPYHPKDLVSSFAREGIICALYEPPVGFPTDRDSEIFKLCERPDIIILDWDFSNDNGAKSLELIVALVKQSVEEFPHHTRLISVYTDEPSLVGVANQLADRLKKEKLEATPMETQCRIRSGATRLIVLGKPQARIGTDEEKFTVKESALATRLIDEFIAMNSGILPSYALHGLAAIRRSSKRILDRFHGDLDGAFIFHRKLVSEDEEAFDQLPELLAEEMRAVVEDERISAATAKRIATAALKSDHILKEDRLLVEMFKPGGKLKPVLAKLKAGPIPIGHLRLAALFSSRTQYSSAARKLGFGTIVRYRAKNSKKTKTAWQYAVCLVPTCDSLRLDPSKAAQFPFWTIEIEAYDKNPRRKGMVLTLEDGSQISLSASGVAGEKLWTDLFSVDEKTKTVIAHRIKGVYKYFGSTKRTIEWLGQLKPLHAHRIAHDITASLSRVGVSEAEWLRLFCDCRNQ